MKKKENKVLMRIEKLKKEIEIAKLDKNFN